MGNPAFVALATQVPAACTTQEDVFEQYRALYPPGEFRARSARRVFERIGVRQRYTVVNAGYYHRERSTEERNAIYVAEAVPLAERAIRAALQQAALPPQAIEDLVVVSCTGIDTPGLDLRLAGRLGMRPDLRRATVLGMGCYAALPGLLRAREAAAAGRLALLVAVELCSLHFQPETTLENIVSTSLFADGAAAAIIGGAGDAAGPRLLDSATHCDYTGFGEMAFRLTNTGFHMRLSAYVPDLLAADVSGFAGGLLRRNGLRPEDVRFWAVHPGSSKILDHVQARLGLTDGQMAFSRGVLRDYGNMSSPTVLFVLNAIMASGAPAPGDYGMLMAFGPGLTMEAALVQW